MTDAGLTAADDPRRFREVLGHFPTGVVVVTAVGPAGRPVGMAVGSFTSVSLDPPLVAFLPGKSSTTFPAIRQAGTFCVNVLSADQEDICRAFAVKGGDKFKGVSWRPGVTGAPVLDDVVAWIDCDLDAVHEAGDHWIAIGRVRALDVGRPAIPLLFFQGGYGGFAPMALAPGADVHLYEHLKVADRAIGEMDRLTSELGVECRAVAPLGGHLVFVAVTRVPGSEAISPRVGLRMPFTPPWGIAFLAWASPGEVERWYGRAAWTVDAGRRRRLDRAMALIRAHGYAVTYRSECSREIDRILDAMVRYGQTPELERRLNRLGVRLGDHVDPDDLDEASARRVRSVSMPVFGPDGRVALLLALFDFPELTRRELERHVRRLREAVTRVTDDLGGRVPDI